MGASVQKEYDLFIGGKWTKSGSKKTIDVLNPATGELLTRVPAGDSRDVDAAVAAARNAFVTWGKTSSVERQGILLEIANRIQKRARDYAELETMNVGKPIRETMNIDIPSVIDHYRYFAGVLRNIQGLTQSIDPTMLHLTFGNRSAWSGTSSRGISPSCSQRGNSRRRWRPGTPW